MAMSTGNAVSVGNPTKKSDYDDVFDNSIEIWKFLNKLSLTNHGVLIGSATGPITPLSVGTSGQFLRGSSGADPSFVTSPVPSGTKTDFFQAAAPTGWTVDNSRTDKSMVVYRNSSAYSTGGGTQDPTAMATPAQEISAGAAAGSITVGANVLIDGTDLTQSVAGSTARPRATKNISSVTLTPKYIYCIVATKN